jgi:hypothetical protein
MASCSPLASLATGHTSVWSTGRVPIKLPPGFQKWQPQRHQQHSPMFKKGLMEHKVAQSLKPLTGDKGQFRQWHLKAMSALSQFNPEYGQILKTMETDMDTGKKQDEVASTLLGHFASYGQFSSDLYLGNTFIDLLFACHVGMGAGDYWLLQSHQHNRRDP